MQAVWFSVSADLAPDATRDFRDLGAMGATPLGGILLYTQRITGLCLLQTVSLIPTLRAQALWTLKGSRSWTCAG